MKQIHDFFEKHSQIQPELKELFLQFAQKLNSDCFQFIEHVVMLPHANNTIELKFKHPLRSITIRLSEKDVTSISTSDGFTTAKTFKHNDCAKIIKFANKVLIN